LAFLKEIRLFPSTVPFEVGTGLIADSSDDRLHRKPIFAGTKRNGTNLLYPFRYEPPTTCSLFSSFFS